MAMLSVKVIPNAKKTEVGDWNGEILRIRLAAPPVEGKANRALIAFLAKSFQIKKSKIRITRGEKNREKLVEIADWSEEDLIAAIEVFTKP